MYNNALDTLKGLSDMLKDELLKLAELLNGSKKQEYNEVSDVNRTDIMWTKTELIKWFESLNGGRIPDYIEVSDANHSQVCIEGEWQNALYYWSLFFDGSKWKYVETDDERGYVFALKEFNDEESAVKYAKRHLYIYYLASVADDSHEAMLRRYIKKNYNCSEIESRMLVKQIKQYKDIFEEFFNYACIEEFCKDDGEQTEACGYTAEILNRDYNMSPLDAYLFLIQLKKNPKEALEDLKNRQ